MVIFVELIWIKSHLYHGNWERYIGYVPFIYFFMTLGFRTNLLAPRLFPGVYVKYYVPFIVLFIRQTEWLSTEYLHTLKNKKEKKKKLNLHI